MPLIQRSFNLRIASSIVANFVHGGNVLMVLVFYYHSKCMFTIIRITSLI